MTEVHQNSDTIVAISTPPGRGGIGIVRLSGPEAASIAAQLRDACASRWSGPRTAGGGVAKTPARPLLRASTRRWSHSSPRPIPTPPKMWWRLPRTARRWCWSCCCAAPWSWARGWPSPANSPQRAFLSGRLDLTQAEAVRDLIDAQTLTQARQAASQMGGALSRRVAPVKQELVELVALLEAGIDFAEDDVDVTPQAEIARRIDELTPPLAALEASFARGRIVHDGLTLAIVGRPNAGKSSLFNRLVERDRAIVTATPGTTRDLVTERISLDGIPIELVDTAGLREGS